MSLTYSQAVDEMFTRFNEAWEAETVAIVGYAPEVHWPGNIESVTPDASKYWARVSVQVVGESQTALSNPAKRFTTFGLIFVQIFGVKSDVSQVAKVRSLGEVAKNAFRGKSTPGAVWFRNTRLTELSPENGMCRVNVIAEFEYDEII